MDVPPSYDAVSTPSSSCAVILTTGVTIASLQPLSLVLLQLYDSMHPIWYYTAGALAGLVGWISVSLSAISDVVDPSWRAASFGLVLAGFSLGFAIAPQLALWLGHWRVSVLSCATVWLGLAVVVLACPETLSPATAAEARRIRRSSRQQLRSSSSSSSTPLWRQQQQQVLWWIGRPLREMGILNRNRLFRLLSCLAFCSGMVSSAE